MKERERAIMAMRRAAQWAVDAGWHVDAAVMAARAGDMDRAAALLRAAAVALEASKADTTYARIALGLARDNG
jgi:hypothetical protein